MSSSILSWQILTAHAQPFREARDLAFCLKVPLDSLLVWASSGGSGETARICRLAWTFAARICDKYQIRLTRSIWCHFFVFFLSVLTSFYTKIMSVWSYFKPVFFAANLENLAQVIVTVHGLSLNVTPEVRNELKIMSFRIIAQHRSANIVMPKGYHYDRIINPYLRAIKNSCSVTTS